MKFLIIRFSSIGDIVLTFPVIRAIKNHFPDAEVHYVTKKQFHEVLKFHPLIDKFFLYENSLAPVIQECRREKYTYILDLHANWRSKWLSFQLKSKVFTFDKKNLDKWKMTFLHQKMEIPHVTDRYLETLKEILPQEDFDLKLEYFCGAEAESFANQLLEKENLSNFLTIVLGATHFTKKWLTEYYCELINCLDTPIVLIGGKSEIKESKIIENQLNGQKLLNLVGETDINESAAILLKSKVVLTHDTGMMHIAAAYQKPLVVIWGNTVPELGFSPYKTKTIHLETELPCRPCSKLGKYHCPKKHFLCMKSIHPEMVKNAILQLWV